MRADYDAMIALGRGGVLLAVLIALADCGGKSRDQGTVAPHGGAAGSPSDPAVPSSGSDAAGASDAGGGSDAGGSDAGEGGGAEAGAAGVAEDPGGFRRWDHEFILAACQKSAQCGYAASLESCLQSSEFLPEYYRFYGIYDWYASQVAWYRLADQATRDACLAGMAAADCDAGDANRELAFGGGVAACQRVKIALSPRQQGEDCAAPSRDLSDQPCDTGLRCASLQGCKVCVAIRQSVPRGIGEFCVQDNECQEDLYCAGGEFPSCRPRTEQPRLGELCTDSPCHLGALQCQKEDSSCAEPGCTSRCVPLVGPGEPCGPGSGSECSSGLYCDEGPAIATGVCRPFGLEGEPCSRADPYRCLQFCVFSSPDAATGTCGRAPRGLPAPCTSAGCPVGAYEDHGPDDSANGSTPYCNCLPILPTDTPCTSAQQCAGMWPWAASNRCVGPAGDRHCGPALPAGAPCTESDQCGDSWSCNESTMTCDPYAGMSCDHAL